MAKTGNKAGTARNSDDHRGDNAAHEPRDSNGRFSASGGTRFPEMKMPDLTARNAALGALGAGIAVAAVAAGSALFKGWNDRRAADQPADDTSPLDDAATIDADKRDAFAPATLPVPSRVEAMGNGDI